MYIVYVSLLIELATTSAVWLYCGEKQPPTKKGTPMSATKKVCTKFANLSNIRTAKYLCLETTLLDGTVIWKQITRNQLLAWCTIEQLHNATTKKDKAGVCYITL